ncbi:MinD/ParA family protein [Thermoleptolyngbya sichuanensis A183]|jgi:MinD-like ATPase involved in chromosome partitioning or flagellar assembly|uniref:MinD/ParA family protein n=2 Tax=Thermoleptolyngbya TaxID=2303528 RepID=A0A6M8B2U2_9CYAN|nr:MULTISPECIES: MinD/ParA family protein [Thermoleptolyngbya]MDG2614784.1 MinD/ParA family protein [Thermoleptolyngbya sichuanensis XZ-Cy5]QKD81439.1 MinD/ParA family protein [Thermoleptolyngbya sichuanensis A183]WOB42188.1 MinD/ParA family protein [Thermoleptolyngbya oregonensis NK1-22]
MSKVVSVHSYRGGTGKSNTTANLATMIARQGYRVGIVDTDIQSPGIHVLFGFAEDDMERSLNDYLWGRRSISDVAYDVTSVLEGKGGDRSKVYLVPSSVKAGEIARVLREGYDVGLLNEGFRELIETLKLDYLFIDTHPGLNEETLLSITISDVLVLILRPDQQDYQGTAVTVDVARKLEVPKLLIVVNKAPQVLDFNQLKQRIEETYDAPVAGILPHSDDMMVLASTGIFTMKYPNNPLTNVVEAIAHQVMA